MNNFYQRRRDRSISLVFGILLLIFVAGPVTAAEQSSRWVASPQLSLDWPEAWPEVVDSVEPPALSGGIGWHELQVSLPEDGDWVIDFRHSSVVGQFEHRVFAEDGQEIARLRGGLQDESLNDFMMRHGRQLTLAAGDYRIVTRTESPFYLAQPTPALFPSHTYDQHYRPTVAFVLIGLGIFGALAFYYLIMGLWRRSSSDLLYVGFIVGNILYNGTALMVPQALGLNTHFYLISFPILVSNLFYVLFVMHLLGISRTRHPRVWSLGAGLSALLILFWPLALIWPNLSLEFCRVGVGLMALYGMVAGITRARLGDRVGWLYLVANLSFLFPALMAITTRQMALGELWLIEHLGLLAVLLEVLLLALLMSYQIGMIHRNQDRVRHLADHDSLTGCLNRGSLQQRLEELLQQSRKSEKALALLFIDLDGFKPINDAYGHGLGDTLLKVIADRIRTRVRATDLVARIGGDEFVVVLYPVQDATMAHRVAEDVRQGIGQTIQLRDLSLTCTGSIGLALAPKHGADRISLTDAADAAMYSAKAQGRNRVVEASAASAVAPGAEPGVNRPDPAESH